ncbi:hypothetical protein B0H11DRAFT_1995913 [Mycena galericulata]|nr:hypothetical protein B0H11DRAFT_1995913 [Mycena galericulata]
MRWSFTERTISNRAPFPSTSPALIEPSHHAPLPTILPRPLAACTCSRSQTQPSHRTPPRWAGFPLSLGVSRMSLETSIGIPPSGDEGFVTPWTACLGRWQARRWTSLQVYRTASSLKAYYVVDDVGTARLATLLAHESCSHPRPAACEEAVGGSPSRRVLRHFPRSMGHLGASSVPTQEPGYSLPIEDSREALDVFSSGVRHDRSQPVSVVSQNSIGLFHYIDGGPS